MHDATKQPAIARVGNNAATMQDATNATTVENNGATLPEVTDATKNSNSRE